MQEVKFNEGQFKCFESRALELVHSYTNTLLRVDVHSRHETTYVFASNWRPKVPHPGLMIRPLHKIRVETMNQMEVLNDQNPPCFACLDMKGIRRGMLHP